MAMILLSDGIYISPAPFIWARVVSFKPNDGNEPPRRPRFFSWLRSRAPQDLRDTHEDRECASLGRYQMGCLAQQMSVAGFDAGAGVRCGCERSDDHCIKRLR